MKRKLLADWTKRLAELCGEGIPLMRALEMAGTEDRMRDVASDLRVMISEGATFAEATAARPSVFDKAYVNMVKCGEVAGVLPQVLGRIHTYILEEMKFSTDLYLYKLSTMMYSGVPILQALWIAGQGLSISEDITPIHDAVKEGEYLATGMEQSGLFTEEQLNVIRQSEGIGMGLHSVAIAVQSIISGQNSLSGQE